MRSPIFRNGGVRGSGFSPRLPNASQYNVLFYLLPFGQNSCVKLWPSNSNACVRVDLRGKIENGTNRNVVLTFLFDFHAQADRAVFGHNTQRARQATDTEFEINVSYTPSVAEAAVSNACITVQFKWNMER